MGKVSIVVVGLGFGSAFVPIYQAHPEVDRVGICELDTRRLHDVGDRHDVQDRFASIEDVLADDRFDAVHLLTPVPDHVRHTLAVLSAGKHCACAVPMATEIDDLHRIIDASNASGKNFMMMETAVYTREFLYARDLMESGALGELTFLRGTYFQDLEGSYPAYWRAQPPMHYATHAVGPVLALAGARATKVCAFGAGRLRPDIQQPGGNQFPLETAIMRLEGTDAVAEITRSWFQTAREYVEAFSVYGDRQGFEWQQLEREDPVIFTLNALRPGHRGRSAPGVRVSVPFRPDLLPAELASFAGGGHGGSHPHLAHEFVTSIVERRPSRIDAVKAADWTAPGICAHESALLDGVPVSIPKFG